MESTERDASALTERWEFARHIRTVTVMGTTVRLVVPTDPTERGASDHMGLRWSGGPISGNNSGASASREPKLGKEMAVVAVRDDLTSDAMPMKAAVQGAPHNGQRGSDLLPIANVASSRVKLWTPETTRQARHWAVRQTGTAFHVHID